MWQHRIGYSPCAGFSVNGEVDESALMRKGGLKPGQILILTKPLGSGVIFAADMRGEAKGSWVTGGQLLYMDILSEMHSKRNVQGLNGNARTQGCIATRCGTSLYIKHTAWLQVN